MRRDVRTSCEIIYASPCAGDKAHDVVLWGIIIRRYGQERLLRGFLSDLPERTLLLCPLPETCGASYLSVLVWQTGPRREILKPTLRKEQTMPHCSPLCARTYVLCVWPVLGVYVQQCISVYRCVCARLAFAGHRTLKRISQRATWKSGPSFHVSMSVCVEFLGSEGVSFERIRKRRSSHVTQIQRGRVLERQRVSFGGETARSGKERVCRWWQCSLFSAMKRIRRGAKDQTTAETSSRKSHRANRDAGERTNVRKYCPNPCGGTRWSPLRRVE